MCTEAQKMQGLVSNASKSFDLNSNGLVPKDWFAVFTVPRHEKRVESHLRLREIENFLPVYKTTRQWKDRSKRVLQLPLFASYIFVRIGSSGRFPVLQVPGVISIVGGRAPLPVPDSYIHSLREGLLQGKIEPHDNLPTGARVRICSGVMVGYQGILIRKKNNFHVVLMLDAIMKSVTVEVEIKDIELVAGHHAPGESGLQPALDVASLPAPGDTSTAC